MLRILNTFLARSDDGQLEVMLSECEVETPTTTMHNVSTRSTYRDRYFREAEGGMRARRVQQIEPGVFRFDDGTIVRRVR